METKVSLAGGAEAARIAEEARRRTSRPASGCCGGEAPAAVTGFCGGGAGEVVGPDPETVVEQVRERYARTARQGGGCCSASAPTVAGTCSTAIGYGADDLASVPEGTDLGLGCGAPLAALGPREGEVVLDLGSGPGLDALLASRLVGPSGRVIGVDMTPDMLERARGNAARAGASNVEFREGRLEALPVEAASVDAVTSNCVINLVPDKAAVFREVARVLRPGGRLVVSDIVLDGELPPAVLRDVQAYVGCVAGAGGRADYFGMVEGAGLGEVEILKDVDYLAAIREAAPEEVEALCARTGVGPEELAGKVRSVTFRARRPGA